MTNALAKITKRISSKVVSMLRTIFKSKKGKESPPPVEEAYKATEAAYEAYRAELIAPLAKEEAVLQNVSVHMY